MKEYPSDVEFYGFARPPCKLKKALSASQHRKEALGILAMSFLGRYSSTPPKTSLFVPLYVAFPFFFPSGVYVLPEYLCHLFPDPYPLRVDIFFYSAFLRVSLYSSKLGRPRPNHILRFRPISAGNYPSSTNSLARHSCRSFLLSKSLFVRKTDASSR